MPIELWLNPLRCWEDIRAEHGHKLANPPVSGQIHYVFHIRPKPSVVLVIDSQSLVKFSDWIPFTNRKTVRFFNQTVPPQQDIMCVVSPGRRNWSYLWIQCIGQSLGYLHSIPFCWLYPTKSTFNVVLNLMKSPWYAMQVFLSIPIMSCPTPVV
jgi:hypothetical protein